MAIGWNHPIGVEVFSIVASLGGHLHKPLSQAATKFQLHVGSTGGEVDLPGLSKSGVHFFLNWLKFLKNLLHNLHFNVTGYLFYGIAIPPVIARRATSHLQIFSVYLTYLL